jgi:arylsulfatase A-like enzyme
MYDMSLYLKYLYPERPGIRIGVVFLITFALQGCSHGDLTEPFFQNVVVIISDDHTYTTVGCYGNPVVRTPNIDRIAADGIRFTNAYANAPICSASRQSLLTGRYPHASGVNLLFTPFNDEMNYTVAEHLQAHGIATGIFGKTHWNDWVYSGYWEKWPTFGFDTVVTSGDWQDWLRRHPPDPIQGRIPTRANSHGRRDILWQKNADMLPVPYRDAESEGTFLASSAIDFIRAHGEKRFFLWLAFHEPHAPFSFPVEYAGRVHPDSVLLQEGSPEDSCWIPEIFRNLTADQKRRIIASYYTSVEYMDKNVGMVLDALDASGIGDRTLVVYLSDQGYLLNDHDRFEKHTMWAESIKAPLIFKGKGLPGGVVSGEVVEFVDLVPTLCEALGVGTFEGLQGESMLPRLTGSGSHSREYAFAEYLEDNMAMVASRRWKYVFTIGKRDLGLGYATGRGPSGVVHMLYDLERDPRETTNLAYCEEYREMVDSLQGVMLHRFMETHPMARYVPSGLKTTGKLIWFCEPTDVGDDTGSGEPDRIFEKKHACD